MISRLFLSIPRNPLEGGLICSISRVSPAEWGTRGAVGIMEEGEGTRAMITTTSNIKLILPLKSRPQSRSSRSPRSHRGSPATAMCLQPQPRTRRSTRTRICRPCRRIISMLGITPPPPPPLPAPYDHHHRNGRGGRGPHHPPNWGGGGRHPYAPTPQPAPYVEHQKAVTIRNVVNLKKETLRVEPDEANPGRFLVAFTFDATVAGSIILYFFAKEGLDCNLSATKDNLVEPITVSFKEGLRQKFRQPSGTGIDFSMFEEVELMKEGEVEVYPLAVKAEASSYDDENPVGENQSLSSLNSQITQAVFEKNEKGDYRVRVVKQILWVNDTRYELQEIYGIGNSVDSDFDGNDPGKECVICLSEPRDTTVLPCRHMCMCSGCANVLRYQMNRCPICRQPVDRLLEIKVNNWPEEQQEEAVDHD